MGYAVRFVLFLCTIAVAFYVYSNPELVGEVREAVESSHDDLIAWGKAKIAFNFTNISSKSISYESLKDDDDSPAKAQPTQEDKGGEEAIETPPFGEPQTSAA